MRRKTVLVGLFVVVCLVLLSVFRIHSFTEPLERDDAYYAVMGREILSGRWPYADVWTQKPPGIHYLYAVAIKLMGYTERSVKVLGLGCSLLTAVGLFLLAARCSSIHGGCFALLLFAVTSSDPRLQGNSCNCEVPMNTLIVWAYYFLSVHLRRSKWWKASISGVLLGLAALIKTVVIAPFLGGLILLLIGGERIEARRRGAHALAYALCAGIPWAVCIAIFGLAGRQGVFWDCVFRFNMLYYAGQKWSEMPLLLILNTRALAATWPIWLLAAVWLIRSAPWRKTVGHMVGAVWFLSTLIEIALPGKYWPHYYYLALPPCLLVMALLIEHVRNIRGKRAFALAGALLAATAYVGAREYKEYLGLEPEKISELKYGSNLFVEGRKVGKLLRQYIPEDEKVFNWGSETELYFYSKARPATRFPVNWAIRFGREQEWLIDEIVEQLGQERPGMIVVSDVVPDELQRFLDEHYDFCVRRWIFTFYTRKGFTVRQPL